MNRIHLLRAVLVLAVVALVPACGGGGGGGGGRRGVRTSDSAGGRASGASTGAITGGRGGSVQAFSEGNVKVGVNPAPTAPVLPAVPTGTPISSGDLTGVDYPQATGNILVAGVVETPGAGGNYTITASVGDIVITGTLQAGDPGAGAPDNIILEAPAGTVYITGSLLTRNSDGTADGDSAGLVTITARRVILTGTIDSSAESNGAGDGGAGGDVSVTTGGFPSTAVGGDILIVGGTILSSGGSGTTSVAATAGDGGDILLAASGEVRVHSSLITRGGSAKGSADLLVGGDGGGVLLEGIAGVSADARVEVPAGNSTTTGDGATGGNAGGLLVNALLSFTAEIPTGPVAVYGTLAGAGGAASAGTGTNAITGGNGGVILVGAPRFQDASNRAPASVDLATANWNHRGGDSDGIAGAGAGMGVVQATMMGNDHLRPGSVPFEGSIDASNGNGGTNSPGDAVVFFGTTQGDVFVRGNIRVGGGSGSGDLTASTQSGTLQVIAGDATEPTSFGSIFVNATVNADGGNSTGDRGARGGRIGLDCVGPVGGSVTIEPGSVLSANGGRGAGTGAGGAGGTLAISTLADYVSISGSFTARGGNATAGTGGSGGSVLVESDDDLDGTGGAITLQAGAVLDVSGGAGTIGGSARSGLANEAVAFNADANGSNAAANGIVLNLGSIIARGGTPDGDGGDVVFNGLRADGATPGPLPGSLDLDGAGPLPTDGSYLPF